MAHVDASSSVQNVARVGDVGASSSVQDVARVGDVEAKTTPPKNDDPVPSQERNELDRRFDLSVTLPADTIPGRCAEEASSDPPILQQARGASRTLHSAAIPVIPVISASPLDVLRRIGATLLRPQGGGEMPWELRHLELAHSDVSGGASVYFHDIYHHRKVLDRDHPELVLVRDPDFMRNCANINVAMRAIVVDWLMQASAKLKLSIYTRIRTIQLMDRFIAIDAQMPRSAQLARSKLQCMVSVALLLASKYEEIYPPGIIDLVYICDKEYTLQDLLDMERIVLHRLSFNVSLPTVMDFLPHALVFTSATKQEAEVAILLIKRIQQEHMFCAFPASLIASASALLSIRLVRSMPFVPVMSVPRGFPGAARSGPKTSHSATTPHPSSSWWTERAQLVLGFTEEQLEPCISEFAVLLERDCHEPDPIVNPTEYDSSTRGMSAYPTNILIERDAKHKLHGVRREGAHLYRYILDRFLQLFVIAKNYHIHSVAATGQQQQQCQNPSLWNNLERRPSLEVLSGLTALKPLTPTRRRDDTVAADTSQRAADSTQAVPKPISSQIIRRTRDFISDSRCKHETYQRAANPMQTRHENLPARADSKPRCTVSVAASIVD